MNTSRRHFLKLGGLAGSGLILPGKGMAGSIHTIIPYKDSDDLLSLSDHLLHTWGAGMLKLQVNNPALKGLHGGILCPSCAMMHGRSGDAIFPLLYLAQKTNNHRYHDAAILLYNWMENMVSMPDGSWVNEISVSDWKGITVFGAVALAEALIHFEHLLDKKTKGKWKERLLKAGDYVYNTFTINTGNINYPIAASYALCLIGNYLDKKHFTARGKAFAHQSLAYFTKRDKLLFGEGKPVPEITPKGCYSVDLGYNVEESLPSLVLYATLMNDTEVLDTVTASLKAHLEFMLPDGAWDNSWGTRNFKWTWWGSRTSDGCQPAYALMADKEPAFYKAALQNTRLLQSCTHDNLLHGGLHYVQHGILPCFNHTLGHSKALTTLLVKSGDMKSNKPTVSQVLPREKEYGVKAFPDIQTWLLAKNKWRATITGYDQEYLMKAGHATGGALALLWHEKTGPLIVAGMNKYQLVESFNMQRDKAPNPTCLTPRFETMRQDNAYTNINDLKATIEYTETDTAINFITHANLVDENQLLLPGQAACVVQYSFSDDVFTIKATYTGEAQSGIIKYFLPIISSSNEKAWAIGPAKLEIIKPNGIVHIEANVPFNTAATSGERIFSFVPGMQAIPLEFSHHDIEIKIFVT